MKKIDLNTALQIDLDNLSNDFKDSAELLEQIGGLKECLKKEIEDLKSEIERLENQGAKKIQSETKKKLKKLTPQQIEKSHLTNENWQKMKRDLHQKEFNQHKLHSVYERLLDKLESLDVTIKEDIYGTPPDQTEETEPPKTTIKKGGLAR